MIMWDLLHFFAFVTNLYSSLYVLYRNPRAAINRLAASILLCFAVWSFGLALIRNGEITLQAALIINNITSIGWISFSSLFIAFCLEFSGHGAILRRPWFIVPAVVLPACLAILQFNNMILGYFIHKPYGWVGMWTSSPWTVLFMVYYLSSTIIGLVVIGRFWKASRDAQKKKQALVLMLTVIASVWGGTLSSVILRLFNIYWIPPLGDVMALAWTAGLFYATVRYRLFEFTPASAADKILETMTESLLLVDPNGRIVNANLSAATLLECSNADVLLGREVLELFPGDAIHTSVRSLFAMHQISNSPVEMRTLKGRIVSVLFSATSLRYEDGLPIGFVCVFRDFSRIKEAEERLVEAKEAAEGANRAKSTFLAIMSHEMRTPLNAILGYARLLMADEPDAYRREQIGYIAQSGDQLLALINEILDFAKLESGTLRLDRAAFSPRAMFDDLRRIFAKRVQDKGLSFTVDVSPDFPAYVDGAGQRLQQVLSNLLDNAVKFTDRGSVSLACSYSNGCATLSVSDTGIGVPERDREAIFTAFRQGDMSYSRLHGGIGLGLAICRRLVEMMDGTLTHVAVPGGGSRFTLSLPLPEAFDAAPPRETDRFAEARLLSPASEPLAASVTAERRVLICDDNDLVRDLIGKILERIGVGYDCVENGNRALAMLRENRYRLLIMDIQMPEMDGVEAIQLIRSDAELRNIYALALTAHALEGDERKYLDAGFNGYISKPIDFSRFITMVNEFLRMG